MTWTFGWKVWLAAIALIVLGAYMSNQRDKEAMKNATACLEGGGEWINVSRDQYRCFIFAEHEGVIL